MTSESAKRIIRATGHRGGLLQRAIDAYPVAMSVFKELVQNSIDTVHGAKSILIEINLDQNTATYLDNGSGMSEKTVGEALNSIGKTVKGGKADRYGRFGIGMVSPLSIFESFEIITATSGHVYQSYEFDRKIMFETGSDDWRFSLQEEPTYLHDDGCTPKRRYVSRHDFESVWWRTQVKMYRLSQDKVKRAFDIEKFKAEVQLEYGTKLVELGTTIKVVITSDGRKTEASFKARRYEGKELPVWRTKEADLGNAEISFFLTPHGYKGPVRIGIGITDNPFRVPFGADRLQQGSFYRLLSEQTKTALSSGMFQGEIVADNLVLRASRKGFEEDDAQMALAVVVDRWFQEVGSFYYNDEKGKREASRHQGLAQEALGRVGDFLKGEKSPFAQLFDDAIFGSIGVGHRDRPLTLVTGGEMLGKSVTKTDKGGSSASGESDADGARSGGERPHHRPTVVVGDGSPRKVVKGHSSGLHVVFVDLGSKLWFFERAGACLKINPTHPLVATVDAYDARVRDLYSKIIVTALRVEMQPGDVRPVAQAFAEQAIDDYVHMMLMRR